MKNTSTVGKVDARSGSVYSELVAPETSPYSRAQDELEKTVAGLQEIVGEVRMRLARFRTEQTVNVNRTPSDVRPENSEAVKFLNQQTALVEGAVAELRCLLGELEI